MPTLYNIDAETVFGNLPVSILIVDFEQNSPIYINPKLLSEIGYSPTTPLSTLGKLNVLIHPDDLTLISKKGNDFLLYSKNNSGITEALRVKCADNKWAKFSYFFLDKVNAGSNALIISLHQLNAEDKADILFQEIIEFAVDGFVIGDKNGIVIKTNQRLLEILGKTKDQVEGHHIKGLFPSEVLKRKPLRFDLLMEGKSVVNQRDVYRPDGTLVNIEMHSKLMPNGNFQAIIRDITDRKSAEQALIEREERYKTLYNYANDAIFLMNDNVFLDCNLKTEEIFGCSKDKLIGCTPLEFSPELQPDGVESKIKAQEMMKQAIEGNSVFFEWVHTRYDGTPFYAEVSLNRLRLDDALTIQAIVRDISKRKKDEQELLQSENLYRSIIQNIEDVYYRFNLSRRLELTSPSAARLLEYSNLDEMQNLSLDDFWLDSEEKNRFLSLIREQERVKEFEATLKTKNGNSVTVSLSASYYKDENGRTQGVEGIIRDITKKKKVELALAQEQFLMHSLMGNVVDQIYFKDLNSKFVRVSQNVAKRFGYENASDIIGKSDFDFFSQEYAENALKSEMQIIETGQPIVDVEEKEIWPDGRVTWVSTTKMPFYDNLGNLVGTFGVSRDITERKNDEISLLQREDRAQKQRTAIAMLATETLPSESHIGQAFNTITAVSAKVLNVSRASIWLLSSDASELKCASLFELSSEKHSSNLTFNSKDYSKFFDTIFKEHRIFATDALSEKRISELREGYLLPLGISSLLYAGILTDGKLAGLICFEQIGEQRKWEVDEESFASTIASMVSQTVSGLERLKIERALRESEKRFRMIIDATNDAIWDWHLQTNKLFFSDRFYTMLGYRPSEFEATYEKWISLMHPHDAGYSEVIIKKYIKEQLSEFNLEYRMKAKNGSWRWIHARGKIVERDKSEAPLRIVGTHMDITDRKLVEEELRESKSLLQSVLDTIPVRVFWKDKNMRYLGCNQWFAKDAGLSSSDDIFGLTDFDLSWKDEAHLYQADDITVMKSGSPKLNYEEPRTTPKGEIRWRRTSKIPFRDSNANIIGVLGTYEDITDSKKSGELIEMERVYFEQLFQSSPEGIVLLDVNDNVIRCNQEFSNIFGYNQDEIAGKPINSLIVPDSLSDEGLNLTKSVASGDIVMHETIRQRKDKSLVQVSILGKPIYFKGGKLAVYGIYRDISDRKRVEEELVHKSNEIEAQNEEYRIINEELYTAKQKAEESDRLKSAFLANMSHEIRTPMNGILGFSQLLVNPNIPEVDVKQYVDVIQSCGNQLLSIINDLIDISKIEANQVAIIESDTNVNETLYEQFLLFQDKATLKGVSLKYSFDLPDEKSSIVTDSGRLKQILTNLIGNALKFTHDGIVSFGYTFKNNYLEFFVEDTGIGISADNYKGIFERFNQVETTISQQFGGTGLGLAISKAFVNKMGGDIWVESEFGRGSKFFFTIPYKPTKSVIEIENKKTISLLEGVPVGAKVLVAEDDDINFFYLKEMLSIYPLEILRASNGFKAIEMVKNNPDIDIVLMDIKMPGMDGHEATREVKKIRRDLPVIAQTAYAFSSDREKAYAAGCDDYISKPLNRVKLVSLLVKYLGQK
jgi:PAS domain S-box-containing protein